MNTGSPIQELSSRGSSGDNADWEVVYKLDEQRRAALKEIDDARYSWWHAKVCAVAGVGFFTDAYDIFAINIAFTMMESAYDQDMAQKLEIGVKVATPVGVLIGQLLFGWLADQLGRKRMYGIELTIMIIATLCQALSAHGPSINIFGVLMFWRFVMGIGIGGDYPLSAVIASEFAPTHIRGRMMTAVFASQGWGNLAACLVSVIVVAAFKNANENEMGLDFDLQWRIVIGLGCVPGVIALWFRLTIPETPRFTLDVERNILRGRADIRNLLGSNRIFDSDSSMIGRRPELPTAGWSDFLSYFSQRKNAKVLFGCAFSWFVLDIPYYALGLNSGDILRTIVPNGIFGHGQTGTYNIIWNVCVGNLILSVAGLIPGYWVCFFLIDKWGRKPIQLMGFAILSVLFIILGFGYPSIIKSNVTPVALLCLANFFSNFGPNTTTFIIPGEAFPTRYRSTAHGISAASGKLGAIVAQIMFTLLKDHGGPRNEGAFIKHLLKIFAFVMMTGVSSTLLLPETSNRSLEDLSNEDQAGFIRGPGDRNFVV